MGGRKVERMAEKKRGGREETSKQESREITVRTKQTHVPILTRK